MLEISDDMKKRLGEPHKFQLPRDGKVDLLFRGWELAEGKDGSGGTSGYACDWTRGVKVDVFLTYKGMLVLWRDYWTRWQGEKGSSQAWICETPEDLAFALRDDEGTIRPAELEALQHIAEVYPEWFSDIAVEFLE